MNVDFAYSLFSHVPSGSFDRPGGHDIIAHMGTSFEGRDLLGTGFVLGGSHPDLLAEPLLLTMEARLEFQVQNFIFTRILSCPTWTCSHQELQL